MSQGTVKDGSDIVELLPALQDTGSLHQRKVVRILTQYDVRKDLKGWSIEVARCREDGYPERLSGFLHLVKRLLHFESGFTGRFMAW